MHHPCPDDADDLRGRITRIMNISIETMVFLLGAFLLLVGLLGGGLVFKEVRIPKIAGLARVLSSVLGLIFIVLSFYVTNIVNQMEDVTQRKTSEVPSAAKVPAEEAPPQVHDQPTAAVPAPPVHEAQPVPPTLPTPHPVQPTPPPVQPAPQPPRQHAAVDLVLHYYRDLDKRDADAAVAKWVRPPRRLREMINPIEYFHVDGIRLLESDEQTAIVWVAVEGKTYGDAPERWQGQIAVEKVAAEWKITAMDLVQR